MNDIDVCIDIGDREWIHISFQEDKAPFVRERTSTKNKKEVAKALYNYFKEYLDEDRRDNSWWVQRSYY